MANTYSSPGTYRAPGMGRQRQPGMGSTGQEAFEPGGSADKNRIDKGFLTERAQPYRDPGKDVYTEKAKQQPLPRYGGIDAQSQPYNPPGAKPQPGFLTGSGPTQQNQYTPPQANTVSYQGQAQGGTTTPPVPAPQKPTWNPQGDPSTWGNQYNQFIAQQNEYNNSQNTGKTREQAQAEIDALNRASGTDPNARLRQIAGGGDGTAMGGPNGPQAPNPAAEKAARDAWLARGGNAFADMTRNQWTPAYADEYAKAFALGSPAPGVVGGIPYGQQRVSNGLNTWQTPDFRVVDQNMIDAENAMAQGTRDIVTGAWVDRNLNPNAGPRNDMPAQRGSSFSDYIQNLPNSLQPGGGVTPMQPILPSGGGAQAPGSGFGAKFLPMPTQPTAPTPTAPTEPGYREGTPGTTETEPRVGVTRPDFLTGQLGGKEKIPMANLYENVPIALPQLSADNVTKGVKDYFLPTEKDEFETEADRLRRDYYVDVPGVLGSAMEETASRFGGQLDSGAAKRIQMRMLQDRTGQLDRDLLQLATARAGARRQASQRLGEFGLAEGSARNREGFTAQQSALGRNQQKEMAGLEGNIQAGLMEQQYGLQGVESEKNRGLTREQGALGRDLQREMIEKQTAAEKELIDTRTGSQQDVIREQGLQQRLGMGEQTAQQREANLYEANYASAVNEGMRYSQQAPALIEQEVRRVMDHPTLTQEQKLGFVAGLRKAQYDRGNLDYTRQQETADRDFQIYAQDWFSKGKENTGRDLPPDLIAAARAQGGVAEMLLNSGQQGGNFEVELAKMQQGQGRFGPTGFQAFVRDAGDVLGLVGQGVALASGIGGLVSGPKKTAPKKTA